MNMLSASQLPQRVSFFNELIEQRNRKLLNQWFHGMESTEDSVINIWALQRYCQRALKHNLIVHKYLLLLTTIRYITYRIKAILSYI